MNLKIAFENSENNIEFLEKDSMIICEVNAYVETSGQKTWDLKPPLTTVFLKDVETIKNLTLYKNKRTNHIGISAELDLLDEGMCGCEFTVTEIEKVDDFPTP